jgi:putative ABC transport system permease protein
MLLLLDMSLAIRNVLRQRQRSAVGLGAIAAGVVALLLSSGFFEWNYDAMRERTIRGRIGHIQVMKRGFADKGTAQPFAFVIAQDSSARTAIESLPEVQTVAPRLAFSGLISVGEATVSFLGEGVDPAREQSLTGAFTIIRGHGLTPGDDGGIVVGQGLAASLGLEVGETAILLANTSSGAVNAAEVQVRGIFSTITKAYDDYAIRLPLPAAERLLRVSGAHMWLVLLQWTNQTDTIAAKLSRLPALADLEVVPWHQTPVADFYNKTVTLYSTQVLVVKVMIAVIIVLCITNTMMANIRERIGEIGTGMALGDRRRTVLRRFLTEGIVLGLLGGVTGAILGTALAGVITWIGIPMPPPPGVADSYVAGILVTPELVIEALTLSVLTAFVAGIYPAAKAAAMPIHEALRHAR